MMCSVVNIDLPPLRQTETNKISDGSPGQGGRSKGSMVLQEDGSVISSTGELASKETLAQSILALVSHNLTVDFGGNQQQQQNGYVNKPGNPMKRSGALEFGKYEAERKR
ncbi:hypothetical protein Ocin01_19699 [Orchesella cincta]|uniref:Uncharacterized protein n=1 Tax=Orchesella cincta TaxID=48709 RepID=A0A1D2M1Y5_ORCCI|nr:hypothetical protein Ocin01_19699 [Orchesella cincta]